MKNEWEHLNNWAESCKYQKHIGDVRLLELITFCRVNNIPDDAQIWIEYPARYGIAQPSEIEHTCDYSEEYIKKETEKHPDTKREDFEQDFIRCMSYAYSKEKNILYIYHHY